MVLFMSVNRLEEKNLTGVIEINNIFLSEDSEICKKFNTKLLNLINNDDIIRNVKADNYNYVTMLEKRW